jgi:ABC-2 type transport system permease protein
VTAALDLTPAPGAAAPVRRVVAHARIEAGLLVRNGEQLLLALVIPVGILVVGRIAGSWVPAMSELAPSVLALAIWSTTFTALAIATGFERRYGVLERLAATPLGRGGLLTGKAVAITAIALGQLVVLSVVALLLGWHPVLTAPSVLSGVVALLLAGVAFARLGLALAGRLRAEVTLALANLVYVVLLVGGGLVIPLDRYPGWLQPAVMLLPTAALGENLRAATTGQTLGWTIPVLVAWCLVGFWLARGFRWSS